MVVVVGSGTGGSGSGSGSSSRVVVGREVAESWSSWWRLGLVMAVSGGEWRCVAGGGGGGGGSGGGDRGRVLLPTSHEAAPR